MQTGAQFTVLNFRIIEEGRYPGNDGGYLMFNKFKVHWRALLDVGTITPDEFSRSTFVQHYRTLREFKAPFEDNDSRVVKSCLRLRSTRRLLTPCLYQQAFANADRAMSSSEFAAPLIPTMGSWSETVFLFALDSHPRVAAQAIVDEFYEAD